MILIPMDSCKKSVEMRETRVRDMVQRRDRKAPHDLMIPDPRLLSAVEVVEEVRKILRTRSGRGESELHGHRAALSRHRPTSVSCPLG